ncbi:HNH endonuclease family protein [Prauserella endophytica]|uniref:HNH endonuclease family protein n=1 Tax=Prauserella endophytica TaxID=1592324 RepID=UPI001E3DC710|nr:HNH endonuclease family protein [Prauserella endophytica]
MNTHTTLRTLAATVLAGLAVTACQLPTAPAHTTTPATLAGELPALQVTPEDTGTHYDRDAWPHWTYHGDGCDTRDLILREQGHGVRVGDDCAITAGQWISAYDGTTVTDPSELDIDHIVPLAEAARSGARHWTERERERYANDPAGLVAVTATSNRAKGDQDPATWLPDRDRCGYVARWVEVKHRYGLTADPAEAAAIRGVLAHCGGGR